MARKKINRGNGKWREHTILVKKTHPYARKKGEAVRVAEYHAKAPAKDSVSTNGTYRVEIRPKTCFRKFRGQRRGPHVTVNWGELRIKMKGKPQCK